MSEKPDMKEQRRDSHGEPIKVPAKRNDKRKGEVKHG